MGLKFTADFIENEAITQIYHFIKDPRSFIHIPTKPPSQLTGNNGSVRFGSFGIIQSLSYRNPRIPSLTKESYAKSRNTQAKSTNQIFTLSPLEFRSGLPNCKPSQTQDSDHATGYWRSCYQFGDISYLHARTHRRINIMASVCDTTSSHSRMGNTFTVSFYLSRIVFPAFQAFPAAEPWKKTEHQLVRRLIFSFNLEHRGIRLDWIRLGSLCRVPPSQSS